MPPDLINQLNHNGFALPPGRIDSDLLSRLDRCFADLVPRAGLRNLLDDFPVARQLLADPFLLQLTRQLFDQPAFVVRATLFDKQPDTNWSVAWHQDQAIAVEKRHDLTGFGPWSIKDGVPHVEPPINILERMTSIRLHLEDCTEDHGPLVVSPATHRLGRLIGDEVAQAVQTHGEVACHINAGSTLVMKPLTLHRSSKMTRGNRRRVIHLDCSDQPLPPPLTWKYNAAFAPRLIKPPPTSPLP